MKEYKLAKENNLSVRVTHVGRDPKFKQLVIVVSVSERQGESERENVHYYIDDEVSNAEMNSAMRKAEAEAINAFLGLCGEKAEEAEDAPALVEENKPEEVKEETEVELEEEIEKPKKRTRKKKAVKKAAKKKAASVEPKEEAPVVDTDEDEDLFDDDEPAVQGEPVLYDKTDLTHKRLLKPLVEDCLGVDWKDDKDCKAKVLALIGELNGQVAVLGKDGKMLASFLQFVKGYLK